MMAAAAHGAARAVAGGPALLFSSDHADNNQRHHSGQNNADDHGRKVFSQPHKRFIVLLSSFFCYIPDFAPIFTLDFSVSDSLYGLNSMVTMKATLRKATIEPMTFPLPENSMPS